MGTTVIELHHLELECVGGDYGEVHLRGTTTEARDAIEQVVSRTRRGTDLPRYSLVVTLDDCEAAVIEGRDAGREGTPEIGVRAPAAHDSGAPSRARAQGETASDDGGR